MSTLPDGFQNVESLFASVGMNADAERDPGFRALKEAQALARSSERQAETAEGDDQDSLRKQASEHWRTLVKGAPGFLSSVAKHTRVACWSTEGLVREFGFEGLAAGFRVLGGLVGECWDELGPLPDEEDLAGLDEDAQKRATDDFKLKWIAVLFSPTGQGGTMLTLPINQVPLGLLEGQPLANWQIEGEIVPEATARQAIASSDPGYVDAVYQEVSDAIDALAALKAAIDQCPGTGFSVEETHFQLLGIKELLESARPDLAGGGDAAATGEEPAAGASASGAPSAAASAPAGGVVMPAATGASREDALKLVMQAAEMLERLEPAGLTAPALKEVVRKARLGPEDLVAELIPDSAQRSDFLLRAGLKLPKSEAQAATSSGSGDGW